MCVGAQSANVKLAMILKGSAANAFPPCANRMFMPFRLRFGSAKCQSNRKVIFR